MARAVALNANMTIMTTSGGKVTMKIGTDAPTAVMVPTRGEKTQDVMENAEEIDEITLKIDGLMDANTTTGGGEMIES